MAPGKIVFHCRGCNRVLSVDDKLKGRKIRCSQCKRISLIPAASTAELPDDTAPQTADDATTIQQPPAESSADGGETATPETEAPPPSDDEAPPPDAPAPPASPSSGATTMRAKKFILKKPVIGKTTEPESEPEPPEAPSGVDTPSTESDAQPESEPAPADDAPPAESPPAPSSGPATVRAKKIILKKPSTAKTTDPEPDTYSDEPKPEAPEAPSGVDTPSTEPDVQTKSEPAPPEPAVADDGDAEDWQTRAQQAEDQVAALTAQREKEEVAYSRTITKLTTQLEEANHRREQLESEATDLRQQQQHWESNAEQQVEAASNVLATAREAVDVFCNDQLGAMQSLRQSLKELTGEEA